jgi:hypothetical protein
MSHGTVESFPGRLSRERLPSRQHRDSSRRRVGVFRDLTHIDESTILITMTKRLQVLFEDEELAAIQRLARRRRQTTAAWVRDTLRAARDAQEYPDPEPKHRAIREALAYDYPSGDIDTINAEIERGYVEPNS